MLKVWWSKGTFNDIKKSGEEQGILAPKMVASAKRLRHRKVYTEIIVKHKNLQKM